MTNRRITEEQFESGSAIDGARIQKALSETESYFNNIPLEAIKEKYSLNYMVFTSLNASVGYQTAAPTVPVQQGGFFHYSPFLPADDDRVIGGVIHPPVKRVKGVFREERVSLDAINTGLTGEKSTSYRVFTASTMFDRPVIIDSICLFMMNRFPGPVVAPPRIQGGEVQAYEGNEKFTTLDASSRSKQRTRILIDTDDVVSAEDRTLNSKEYVLQDFQEAFWSPSQWVGSAGAQMSPATAEDPVTGQFMKNAAHEGLYLTKQNLNIPIHQLARTRFRVVSYAPGVPSPNPTLPTVDFLKDIKPENMTFTVVYKEALIRG